MEKIVYILGAGFSAPLNLPVMSNFLEKSKDMYFAESEKYSYFKNVFDNIREMSYAKNYYNCDLTNIEEILSILEMQERFGNRRLKKSFIKFISDVIDHYTPEIIFEPKDLPNRWDEHLFSNQLQRYYGYFVANLLNIKISSHRSEDHGARNIELRIHKNDKNNFEYSIITLNYDLILEKLISILNQINREPCKILANRAPSSATGDSINIFLSKLHGSIETENIVPPTWNKIIDNRIETEWKLAYKVLQEANHIRILGYSLPETDSYIKFLLKSSAVFSPHLKSFDVICIDDKMHSIQNRYTSFITTKKFRFVDGLVQDYLAILYEKQRQSFKVADSTTFVFDFLEKAHSDYFKSNYSV